MVTKQKETEQKGKTKHYETSLSLRKRDSKPSGGRS